VIPAIAQDITMVPMTIDGETVSLAMRIYKPAIVGPAPTLVFNHGSTGRGNDPSLFVRPIDFPPLAQFFVERGWAVVMPARRGRGRLGIPEALSQGRARGHECTSWRRGQGFAQLAGAAQGAGLQKAEGSGEPAAPAGARGAAG